MKYCIQCGQQLEDAARFCFRCGYACESWENGNGSVPQAPEINAYRPDVNTSDDEGKRKVNSLIKNSFTSPVYMVMAIAFSVALFINLTLVLKSLPELLEMYLQDAGADTSEIVWILTDMPIIEALEDSWELFMLVLQMPNIIVVVALWLTFSSARSNVNRVDARGVSSVGKLYTVLRVAVTVLMGLLAIMVIVAWGKVPNYEYYNRVRTILFVMFILMCAATAVVWWLYGRIVSFLETLEYTIQFGTNVAALNMVVIVYAFVAGGFSALTIFSSSGTILWLSLANATAQIMAGVFMYQLRNNLNTLRIMERSTLYTNAMK